MTHAKKLKQQLDGIKPAEALMQFFEIDFESRFMNEHRDELVKRFRGNVIISKPDDWFLYRRCLKNVYCRIQRSALPKCGLSACRGCTSCERR